MPICIRLVLFLALCLTSPALFAGSNIEVQTARDGEFIVIQASVEIQEDPSVIWEVLTDYDHLAEFIPDMKISRVIARTADGVVVEQKGEMSFLFFTQSIEAQLAVIETPPRRISSRAISGSFKELVGNYDLNPTPDGGVRLHYIGRMIPDFIMPPLFGMLAVRSAAEKRFSALVQEIAKRGKAQREQGAGKRPE